MPSAVVSIVGTTTSVRNEGGSPSEKSMRGSGCGVTSSVTTQFTMPTASWLVASSSRTPSPASAALPTFSARASIKSATVSPPAIAAIVPR